jgi:uncharacterized membrane protein SpoIIM required for sporulation/ABC-type transport system involved in multi-copper enzyme maturation permease subunit
MGETVASPQVLQGAAEHIKVETTPPPGLRPEAYLPFGQRRQPAGWREQLSLVLVITRREIRDTMRDWRLVVPIVLLTLVFPVLLNLVAKVTLNYVRQYKASVIGEQTIPFLLLVVGFFPISFSLVIALETFVGEKERQSLEPLLATPLSNTQLYLGKTLAAMIPPVLASYLGIFVYLGSLFLSIHYRPPLVLVLQIVLLSTAEALVMVSGAVIISSQTTSVRAANLLASFIILPMAFLVQGEAIILFWSHYEALWFVLLGLIVSDLILVRMGIRIFNREELLGRGIDSLNLRRSWRWFKEYLLNSPATATPDVGRKERPSLAVFYRRDISKLLRLNRLALGAVLLSLTAAALIGWLYAVRYPLPAEALALEGLSHETFDQFTGVSFLPTFSTWGILSNNVRALLAATLLAVLSFGSIAVVLLMAPIAIIGFLTAQAAMAGYNPLIFVGAFVLPHGIVELPAAIIATAMALRLGASVVSPPPGMTVSQSWLQALAHFVKVFVLVVLPLLVVAAFIEVHVTPQVVIAVYGS